MKKKLYLCEKPSQARDIARILGVNGRGEGYIADDTRVVTWCLGHLLALAPPDHYCENLKPWRMSVLPVIPAQWTMQPVARTHDQFKVIEALLKHTEHVVIATDADREGDVIGREVLEYCQYQGKVERLWLSALDDSSIKKALAAIRPGGSTENLYQAGLGRQRADWGIGMNLTMAASCLFSQSGQGVLSIGRVQTPTLSLVVERDRLIEDFKGHFYYDLTVTFKSEPGSFVTKWVVSEDAADEKGRCIKKEAANEVAAAIKDQQGIVEKFTTTQKRTSPPLPFSLSTLQKLCSSKLGMTAKETLKTAQALYETHKATTYPRTDSGYLPISQINEVPGILSALGEVDPTLTPLIENCDPSQKSPSWNDAKVTAHHGIIPTANTQVALSRMSAKERAVYNIISRYYLAQFLGDHEYEHRTVLAAVKGYRFEASCNLPLVPGWKLAIRPEQRDEEEKKDNAPLPKLTEGEAALVTQCDCAEKKTKPPARFTEGTLIAAMKNIAKFIANPELKKTLRDTSGIGTEATRADIIEKLLSREFLRRDKKKLISTERGRSLIDIVPADMKDAGTTALWEQALDDIAKGEGDLTAFMSKQGQRLDEMLTELQAIRKKPPKSFAAGPSHDCPTCQSPIFRRKGKSGFFWGCSAYPECKTTREDKDGKPVERSVIVSSDITCPACKKGHLARRPGKEKGFWWGCDQFPTCRGVYWDQSGKPNLETPQREKK